MQYINNNKNKINNQYRLKYHMMPKGTQELNSNSYTHGFKEEMHWIPIKDLDKYKAYPSFLKDYLKEEHSSIVHIITDERK